MNQKECVIKKQHKCAWGTSNIVIFVQTTVNPLTAGFKPFKPPYGSTYAHNLCNKYKYAVKLKYHSSFKTEVTQNLQQTRKQKHYTVGHTLLPITV